MAASITIAVVQDKNATHYQFSRLSLSPDPVGGIIQSNSCRITLKESLIFLNFLTYKEYYVLEQVGNEYPDLYSVKIDWDNKLFFIEGDGHNDGPIKNYKESVNAFPYFALKI